MASRLDADLDGYVADRTREGARGCLWTVWNYTL